MDNGVLMWLLAYFAAETLKTRRKWENIFVSKKKDFNQRKKDIEKLYPSKKWGKN